MEPLFSESEENLYEQHLGELHRCYTQLLDKYQLDGVLIYGGRAQEKLCADDQYGPLRMNPYFQQWSPLENSESFIYVSADVHLLQLHVENYWEKSVAAVSGSESSILKVNLFETIDAMQHALDTISTKRTVFLCNPSHSGHLWKVHSAKTPPGLVEDFQLMQSLKSQYEVHCISRANRQAVHGHRVLQDTFKTSSVSEFDLHLRYLSVTNQDDWQTPYKNIVALNQNAAVLHYVSYEKIPPTTTTQSLLVDAGATYRGYQSDITRTVCKGTSTLQRDFDQLIQEVDRIKNELIEGIAIGVNYEELHDRCLVLMAQLLIESDWCLGRVEELVERKIVHVFMPHGVGHSLGLQTHDVGCRPHTPKETNPHLRNTSTIEENQVFTIEPGLYLIPSLLESLRVSTSAGLIHWKSIERFMQLGGIRMEDNVWVNDNGVTNLTRQAWEQQALPGSAPPVH